MKDIHTTDSYLAGEETTRRRELVYGMLREPPSPYYPHQAIVTSLAATLAPHVRERGLGRLCVSPIDVVLDESKALIVQPDVVFVSTARLDIIRNQIWGAPDLVIEVLSWGTTRYDRTRKLAWYRRYGVGEYWLVDAHDRAIEVVGFPATPRGRLRRRVFTGRTPVVSAVWPDLRMPAAVAFD